MAGPGDPVSTFLKHVVPWANNTYVNIEAFEWVPKPGFPPEAGEGTISPRGSRAARDLQEAVNFAKWQDGLGREVYIRMVSHRHPGAGKTDKRGRTYYRALGGAANAAEAKDFWADVDIKPTGHGSPQLAQDAVRAMCAAIGLPEPTMMVYSGGGGFHAHWILPVAIPIEQWRPLARALAEACKAHGVHADHNLTVNTVCLLRVPGTHNRKYGTPRPVLLGPLNPAVPLEVFEKAVAPYLGLGTQPSAGNNPQSPLPGGSAPAWDLSGFPTRPPVKLDEAFLGGLNENFSPYTLEEVSKGCPLVEKTLETGGAGQDNNLWFAVSHVALFTAGGVEDLIKLSDGHATYNKAETEALYARNLATKEATDQGWPRCQTLELAGSPYCAGCRNKTHNKSPLNFAVKDPVVTPPSNPPDPVESGDNSPSERKLEHVEGYVEDLTTGVYSYMEKRKTKTAEWEEEIKLCAYGLWNLDYKRDHAGRFCVHFDTQVGTHDWVHPVVPSDACADGTRLKQCLESFGLGIKPDETKGLSIFMAAFKSQMARVRNRVTRHELMGWYEEDGKVAGFIYGRHKFGKNGATHFDQTDKVILEDYLPVGTIEPWTKAIKMINGEKRPEMDLLVATAFAAPLMKFVGEKGVVISAYSSATAAHKTTAIRIGQSTWGAFKAINQLTDTSNSVMEKVGKTRVVPTYFDEMKGSRDIKRFADMTYMFTGGKGKGRLNRNAEIRDVATWDTLLVGVSNESLFDHIAQHDKNTDAGVARIFEFEVGSAANLTVGQIDMGKAGEILKSLETNYGHGGLLYAAHLGKVVDTLQGRVSAKVTYFKTHLNCDNSERFWVAAAAVLMVGAELANEAGLTEFDLLRMETFIGNIFRRMRLAKQSGELDISKVENIRAALSDYLSSNRQLILATAAAGTGGRVGALNPVTVLNYSDIQHSRSFDVRYIQSAAQNTPIMWLRKAALINWLTEKKYPPGMFIQALTKLYSARELQRNITSGVKAGSPSRVIELDLSLPDLIDLYEVQ